jgi:hypothetical protein
MYEPRRVWKNVRGVSEICFGGDGLPWMCLWLAFEGVSDAFLWRVRVFVLAGWFVGLDSIFWSGLLGRAVVGDAGAEMWWYRQHPNGGTLTNPEGE